MNQLIMESFQEDLLAVEETVGGFARKWRSYFKELDDREPGYRFDKAVQEEQDVEDTLSDWRDIVKWWGTRQDLSIHDEADFEDTELEEEIFDAYCNSISASVPAVHAEPCEYQDYGTTY